MDAVFLYLVFWLCRNENEVVSFNCYRKHSCKTGSGSELACSLTLFFIYWDRAEKRPLPSFVQRLLVQLEHGYQHYIGFEGHKEAVNSLSGKAMALRNSEWLQQ